MVGLLSLIRVPGSSPDFSQLQGAEILVEQSLSALGTQTPFFCCTAAGWRSVVFVEGKVKRSQVGNWTAYGAWHEFLIRKKDGKLDSSNLFTQLYHKVRFVTALHDEGIAGLQQGVQFPSCSTQTVRKLGSNPVVERAAGMIEKYLGDALYVAVVPDSEDTSRGLLLAMNSLGSGG